MTDIILKSQDNRLICYPTQAGDFIKFYDKKGKFLCTTFDPTRLIFKEYCKQFITSPTL